MNRTCPIGALGATAAAWLLAFAALADTPGSPLDLQEADLRTALAPTAAVITRNGEAVKVDYPIRLAFVPDGVQLLPAGAQMLGIVGRSLRAHEHSHGGGAGYSGAIRRHRIKQKQDLARA